MQLLFIDSKGHQEVVCETDDVAQMIEPMMAHKAKRHIYSSGPFSLPGAMDPGSMYTLQQESNGCYYAVKDTRPERGKRAKSPICDVCDASDC